jgi:hypothetical protein
LSHPERYRHLQSQPPAGNHHIRRGVNVFNGILGAGSQGVTLKTRIKGRKFQPLSKKDLSQSSSQGQAFFLFLEEISPHGIKTSAPKEQRTL